jgi:hypothetical protein
VWNNEFQLDTMEANIIISLFTTMFNIEENMDIDEPYTNPTKITSLVMECYLNEEFTLTSIPTFLPSSSVRVGGLKL